MGMMFKNGIPYAGIPEEIDAATVGGHTVEADVPADAAFTDTINSDVTVEGNPVILKELQGGVPFSEITVKGENISGQEMTLTATSKNQLPITVTSGTGAGVTYTVDNDEITVSGTTTGVSTITISAPNMTITQDMRLSYRGNLSGMTPKATVLRNGEKTVYPTPNDTTGSKLLAGDVLQNVYIQQQSADVAVSGSAKFQLEYGTEVTEYEKYSSEVCTFTPNSADYAIPTDITQKEGINVLAIDAEGATLSVTGVRTNAAVAKLWDKAAVPYTAEPVASTANGLNPTLDNSTSAKIISFLGDGETIQTPGKYLTELTTTDRGVQTNKIPCKKGDVIILSLSEARGLEVPEEYSDGTTGKIVKSGTETTWTHTASANTVSVQLLIVGGTIDDNITVTVNGSEYNNPSPTNKVPIHGVGESGSLSVKSTGANIFGGLPFAQALVNSGSTNVVLDTDAKTVTFSHNTNYENKESMFENFKENTQYSFMLKGTHTNGGTVNFHNNTNLIWEYTDGTREQILLSKTGSFKEVIKSNSKKSVAYFGYCWQEANDELVLDYEQCGIFEGVITADEFEPYVETKAEIPLSAPLYEGDYIEVYADGSGQIYRKNRRFKPTTIKDVHATLGARVSLNSIYGKNTLTSYSNYFIPYDYNIHLSDHTNTFSLGNNKVGAYIDVFFMIDGLTTKEEYQAWLDEHSDLEFVYELTTPTTEPLTAEQVAEIEKLRTYKGVTHVTADGEVTMRYYCDNASGETVSMLQGMVEETKEDLEDLTVTVEQNREDIMDRVGELEGTVDEIPRKPIEQFVNTDLNTLLTQGKIYNVLLPINKPDGFSGGLLFVASYSSPSNGEVSQYLIDLSSGKRYLREWMRGVFGDWKEV